MPSSETEEIEGILKAVSEQIPALMKGLVTSIVSAEAGKNMGGAVANFYKELKSSGMADEAVMRMTQEYAKTFNDLGKLMRETVGQRGELQRPKAAKEEPATQEEKDEG